MGIALSHPSLGSTSWFSAMDGNLDTLEEEFFARLNSDASNVTVTGTTSETALQANATVPANSLQAGSVLHHFAYGTVTIPASSTPSATWRFRWGGTGGVLLTPGFVWNFSSDPNPYTLPWIAEYRLIPVSVGASGVFEVVGFMTMGTTFVTGTTTSTTGSIDTTADTVLGWTVQPSASGVSVTQRVTVLQRG
ncbi:MAG: hypothetical protein AB7N76_19515 [Planctomycetota bacterium]